MKNETLKTNDQDLAKVEPADLAASVTDQEVNKALDAASDFDLNSMFEVTSDDATEEELEIAKNDLIAQKPLVQAYVVDQVRDKMIGGEAALGVIYSGEAIYTQRENADLEYVVPEEGTNVWIDGWVIPKNAPNVENAQKFIDFMCRPDIALLNFDYITYSTPNVAAQELIEDEDIRNSTIAFPDLSQYNNLETYLYLGTEGDELYNRLWKEVMSN